jgi:hypothetical protein
MVEVCVITDESLGADSVDVDTADRQVIEAVVDQDIEAFADFYTRFLKNGSLIPFERAAIKTYIAWKLGLGKK